MISSHHHGCPPNRTSRRILAVSAALLLLAACGDSEDSASEDTATAGATAEESSAPAETSEESSAPPETSEESSAPATTSAATDTQATAAEGETDEAAVAAAQQRLEPYLIPVEETTIEVETPLTERPPTGLSVYVIRYNNPAAAVFDQGMMDAGAALGWNVDITAVDATDPQAIPNAMLRAISENADFIEISAGNIQALGEGMGAAMEAGIPVVFGAGVGEPQGEANGLYGNTLSDGTMVNVLATVDKVIVDSGGVGSMLLVNAPDFPILAPIDPAAQQHVADNCPRCTLELLPIAAADLGGDVASNIVSALRRSSDIEYVVTTFSTLAIGLRPALDAAGLNEIKIYLSGADEADVELIANGDVEAGVLYPRNGYPWLLFDQIARISVGMDPLQEQHAATNLQLWTADNIPEGQTTWDSPNLEEQYKELWQIS
jgi:ABC-type sugar transport system substrate-binding protein